MFNEKLVRNQFPILKSKINGNSLVYLDNAATSQKPNQVINKLNEYYLKSNANIHRGVFKLSEEATIAYESTRGKVAKFLNVENQDQIIFVKGVTEGINLVANCFSDVILKKGDEILISEMEHHANIVPWQIACKKIGAKLKVIPV